MSYPVRLALLALACLTFGTPPCLAGDLEDVKALIEGATAALNAKDAAGLIAMAHDNTIGYEALLPIAGDLKVIGREQGTKNFAASFAATDQINITLVNPQYRVTGNTAVAWGHRVVMAKPKDAAGRMMFQRFTVTAVKTGGKWQVLSYHYSVVPSDSW
jgi:uncharacterized protein (TIGR02246 family)